MTSSSASYSVPAAPSLAAGAHVPTRARRYLDAQNGDYVVEHGALKQDAGFTSKVVLALRTRLGSALAAPSFGSRLHEVQHADERNRKLAERHAARAVAHLAREVDELRVVATLPKDRPGAIEIEVSGRKAMAVVSARYTQEIG